VGFFFFTRLQNFLELGLVPAATDSKLSLFLLDDLYRRSAVETTSRHREAQGMG